MWLIVGLGNPDAKYAGNRHNVGHQMLDALADRYGPVSWRNKFSGKAGEMFVDTPSGRAKVLLLKPETYYNESGRSVRAALDFHKLKPEQVCVFHDELALAPGKFRLKKGGGTAGNNGLKSITAALGPDFYRARIGIGHPGDKSKVTSYVLRDFAKADLGWLSDLTDAVTKSFPLLIDKQMDGFQTKVTHLAPAPQQVSKGN
jgi:PTH1 family peptidyl-tRNA hydrolase